VIELQNPIANRMRTNRGFVLNHVSSADPNDRIQTADLATGKTTKIAREKGLIQNVEQSSVNESIRFGEKGC
jgi:hypothetical protein